MKVSGCSLGWNKCSFFPVGLSRVQLLPYFSLCFIPSHRVSSSLIHPCSIFSGYNTHLLLMNMRDGQRESPRHNGGRSLHSLPDRASVTCEQKMCSLDQRNMTAGVRQLKMTNHYHYMVQTSLSFLWARKYYLHAHI